MEIFNSVKQTAQKTSQAISEALEHENTKAALEWMKKTDKSNLGEVVVSILKKNQTNIQRWILSSLGKVGNITAITIAWITAIYAIVAIAMPPYINEAIPLLAIFLTAMVAGLPMFYRPLQRLIGRTVFNLIRGITFLTILITLPEFLVSYEIDKYNAMSPEQKARKAKADEAWGELERKSRATRELDEQQNINSAQEKLEIETENAQQEAFYEQLGAPKLLYKCKGRTDKKAIGANFGTFNRLIEDASRTCGTGNVDILKRKD